MFWCSASLGWTTGSHFHTGSVSASRSSLPGCSAAATTLIRGTDKLLQAEAIEADAAKRSLVVQTAQSAFMFADMDGSGTIDFAEMNKMMERMLDLKEGCSIAQLDDGEEMPEGCTALEEVQDMFRQYDTDGDGDLSYNEFLLLLADCSIESALFQGLLTFAEDAVQAGVLGKLKAGSSALVDRRSSHILDNGTPAWRESIEAAFDLCDNDRGGKITAEEAIQAVTKYPLIAQLLHVPVELDDEGVKEHMRELCDLINTDGDEGIDREEWIEYFCPAREAVAQASRWEPGSAECSKVTGYIFDCDGTIYQPSGMIPGAEDVLTMLERTGCQYALLSNTGAKPHSAVQEKLATGLFECQPCASPIPPGRIYTAADAQVDFMLSGHLPRGSRLLVVAADDRWKDMMRAQDAALFDSWEVAETMDVDTAKEWSQHAAASLQWQEAATSDPRQNAQSGFCYSDSGCDAVYDESGPPPKVAVVFFHDGTVSGWSDELLHSMTILLHFGADFIYTAEDPVNPSIDERYPGITFPMPGPGMFVEMLKKSMPPASGGRTFCCGKGGNVGRKFMIDRAIQMLKAQGHSGEREHIMIVGDRFDTDVRAGVLAGIKSCLLESGAHTLEMADEFPTDLPSYTLQDISGMLPVTTLSLEDFD